MERIIPILSVLKLKWGCRRSWVTHTLLLLGKGLRVFILCFPPEKWKFPPFYRTKKNMNHVVSLAPNSILTMTYKALHNSGSIYSPSSWQYPSYLTQLSPDSSFLFPTGTRSFLTSQTLHILFLLTAFPTSLHTVIVWFPQGGLCLGKSPPSHGAVQHVNLASLISLFYLLPLLECKLHESQTVFYPVFCSTGNI